MDTTLTNHLYSVMNPVTSIVGYVKDVDKKVINRVNLMKSMIVRWYLLRKGKLKVNVFVIVKSME